jgi:hypothetical protein
LSVLFMPVPFERLQVLSNLGPPPPEHIAATT